MLVKNVKHWKTFSSIECTKVIFCAILDTYLESYSLKYKPKRQLRANVRYEKFRSFLFLFISIQMQILAEERKTFKYSVQTIAPKSLFRVFVLLSSLKVIMKWTHAHFIICLREIWFIGQSFHCWPFSVRSTRESKCSYLHSCVNGILDLNCFHFNADMHFFLQPIVSRRRF